MMTQVKNKNKPPELR